MHKYVLLFLLLPISVNAYQVGKTKELGVGESKNQNVAVTCTTEMGDLSKENCVLRRYAKCNDKKVCNGWLPWKNVHNPVGEFATWREAAEACCLEKGLR